MEWVALISTALSIVLLILNRLEKSKSDKARGIIMRSRAEAAKDKYYGQTRDTDEQEKRNDQLLADLDAVLSVWKKTNPSP